MISARVAHMEPGLIVGYIIGLVISIAILWFVIKSAVKGALREHQEWLEARGIEPAKTKQTTVRPAPPGSKLEQVRAALDEGQSKHG